MSIDNFKAKLAGGGARPNLFKVTCNFPAFAQGDAELGSFLIKGASIPSGVVGVIEVPYRGRKLKIAGDRTFEPLSLTVINDTGFVLRNAFERWQNAIQDHERNSGALIPADYQMDLSIEQLGKDDAILKKYNFRGVWPSNVSTIELNFETNDALEEFTVELQFNYWDTDGITS
tara:strand:- start:1435 stop:1956 length:522 start_codon:yes stop_codon:yes gene_type:complete